VAQSRRERLEQANDRQRTVAVAESSMRLGVSPVERCHAAGRRQWKCQQVRV